MKKKSEKMKRNKTASFLNFYSTCAERVMAKFNRVTCSRVIRSPGVHPSIDLLEATQCLAPTEQTQRSYFLVARTSRRVLFLEGRSSRLRFLSLSFFLYSRGCFCRVYARPIMPSFLCKVLHLHT